MVLGAGSTVGQDRGLKFDVDSILHDVRQTLRVSGVGLNFSVWAKQGALLPVLWRAIKPNAETRGFEQASDRLRALGVHYASRLGRLGASTDINVGESQAWQIQAALKLYHYLNPKLMLLTSALRLSLLVEGPPGNPTRHSERIERGVPDGMYPMEQESDTPKNPLLNKLFAEMKTELNLAKVSSDYRTLALWPDYLDAVWKNLKPVIRRVEYDYACDRLREESRSTALNLPCPIRLRMEDIQATGQDPKSVLRTMDEFERILPGLILNVALISLDWTQPRPLSDSPFPAGVR